MADSKLISLSRYREKKKKEEEDRRYPGKMVWLHCPKCNTLEYSEIIAPNGRTHKCGAPVNESEVDLDLRAEFTITLHNIKKIDEHIEKNSQFKRIKIISKSLDDALRALKNSEETYLERLSLAAGGKIDPYPGKIGDMADKLPIRETNKMGLLISEFRFEPEKRFTP